MKNRKSDAKIFGQGTYILRFVLSAFQFWKLRNHCYELRDLAVLGGKSKHKIYWAWRYNYDGSRVRKIVKYSEWTKSELGFSKQHAAMDFVYLDEIQDVSLHVIMDLDLIAKLRVRGIWRQRAEYHKRG